MTWLNGDYERLTATMATQEQRHRCLRCSGGGRDGPHCRAAVFAESRVT